MFLVKANPMASETNTLQIAASQTGCGCDKLEACMNSAAEGISPTSEVNGVALIDAYGKEVRFNFAPWATLKELKNEFAKAIKSAGYMTDGTKSIEFITSGTSTYIYIYGEVKIVKMFVADEEIFFTQQCCPVLFCDNKLAVKTDGALSVNGVVTQVTGIVWGTTTDAVVKSKFATAASVAPQVVSVVKDLLNAQWVVTIQDENTVVYKYNNKTALQCNCKRSYKDCYPQ